MGAPRRCVHFQADAVRRAVDATLPVGEVTQLDRSVEGKAAVAVGADRGGHVCVLERVYCTVIVHTATFLRFPFEIIF